MTASSDHIAVFLPDGSIVYNDPSLEGSVTVRSRERNSAIATRSPQTVIDPVNTYTGPSRRIWAYPKSSVFSAGQATEESSFVSVPCNNGNIVRGDAGMIYMGGVSQSEDSVDAGLQYNLNNPKSPNPMLDQYGMFIRDVQYAQTNPGSNGYVPGFWADATSQQKLTDPNKFVVPCDNSIPVLMSFLVQDLNLSSQGLPSGVAMIVDVVQYGASTWYVWETGQPTYAGWSNDCNQCILKRTTSIAQSFGTIYNGDHFGTTWSQATLECGFDPQGCQYVDQMKPWTFGNTQGCDDYPNWPNTAPGSEQDCKSSSGNSGQTINVTNFTYDGESDSIQLPNVVSPNPQPSSNPGLQPTSVAGVSSDVLFSTVLGSPNRVLEDVFLYNTTSSPITLSYLNCGITASVITAAAPYQSLAQYPGTGTRCSQLVNYVTIQPQGSQGSVFHLPQIGMPYAWTGPVIASVNIGGILTSSGTPVTLNPTEAELAPIAPTPTPRPVSTPNPCLRNPRLCM